MTRVCVSRSRLLLTRRRDILSSLHVLNQLLQVFWLGLVELLKFLFLAASPEIRRGLVQTPGARQLLHAHKDEAKPRALVHIASPSSVLAT